MICRPVTCFIPRIFGAFKNHLYLLEGLLELERQHGIILHAVFCGGGDPGRSRGSRATSRRHWG